MRNLIRQTASMASETTRQLGQNASPKDPLGAELAPVSTAAAIVLKTQRLSLGLMVAKADGTRDELDCLGYQRQQVELSPRSPTHLGIGRPVLFEIFGCPPVTGLALFDTGGQIVAEGPLGGTTAEVHPPARFEFAAHQILVRRSANGASR